VEDAAAVHKALMGNSSQQGRTVTLLFSSDAGRSTSGYVAKVIMAVTNSGDSAQLSDVHRVGRGRLAVRPLCGDGRAADRFIIIRYPPGELSLLFEVTMLGTRLYLILLWGVDGLAQAEAASPHIVKIVHAHRQQLAMGACVVARILLPFLLISNENLQRGGENSLLMQLLSKGSAFLFTFPLYKHVSQYRGIVLTDEVAHRATVEAAVAAGTVNMHGGRSESAVDTADVLHLRLLLLQQLLQQLQSPLLILAVILHNK
jgi:hypothetical protein